MSPTLVRQVPRVLRRGLLALALTIACSTAAFAGGSHETEATPQAAHSAVAPVRVVAAENFYGDIAAQIAGPYAHVTSIMSNPNIDPHEYESNVDNAKAVADANLVIENGDGYDSWMDKLLAASPDRSRIVVTGYDVAPTRLPENVHVWYDLDDAAAVAKAIEAALAKLDPTHAADFEAGYATFTRSLGKIREKMAEIRAKYRGTPIALTETIFLYQALPMALEVLTPLEFMKAIAEGNDPSADAAVTAEAQVRGRKVRILIYNAQTVDRITKKLRNDAKAEGIPVVPVTETMPPGLHYQSWMLKQLDEVEQALGS